MRRRTATTIRASRNTDGSYDLHAHVIHAGEGLPPGIVEFPGIGSATVSANVDPDVTGCGQPWCARLTTDGPLSDNLTTRAVYAPQDDEWRGSESARITLKAGE